MVFCVLHARGILRVNCWYVALFHACLLLFIGHGFFFGHLKTSAFLGVFFYAKSVGFWGGASDPHRGPPGWTGGAPPSRTLPGALRHLTLAAALFIPFLRHCTNYTAPHSHIYRTARIFLRQINITINNLRWSGHARASRKDARCVCMSL